MANTGSDKPDISKPENSVVPNVPDAADVSPRSPEADMSGKRIRAIPQRGGSKVHVRAIDFRNNGIEHGDVTFDYFKDNFTLKVGVGISQDAADLLVKIAPETYEYMN